MSGVTFAQIKSVSSCQEN